MIELIVKYFLHASVVIETQIWNNSLKKFSDCYMVFDTGAYMTALDTKLALRSGYSLKGAKEVSVMGIGKSGIPAKRIVIPELILGGTNLGPILADVLDFPEESNTSAILGMNVIKHFKLTADFDDKRPDGRDATIYLEPDFNINDKECLENFVPEKSRFGIWSMAQIINKK